MKIGFCAGLDRIEEVAAAGFDYIEPPVSAMAAWTEEEFSQKCEKAKRVGLPVYAFNVMFPGNLSLLDKHTTDEEIGAYLDRAFARVQRLGGQMAVFGSGKSRRRPDGMSYQEAFLRLCEIARLIGDAGERYGVTIAVEPLNSGETNMINSVAEGAAMVAAIRHPRVKLLADYYHIAVEGQPTEDVARVGGVAHVHIATREERYIPLTPMDGYRQLFASLHKTGYTGCISVEGRSDCLSAEGPLAVAMLKKLYREAETF
ncbi:MAG: sugar phosphate isomerase/epimerase [Clostridia bacterium]|nr:sugar phosphate isomerase/epimerase [Clostridia bacterium]